jgi:hypothetical protein
LRVDHGGAFGDNPARLLPALRFHRALYSAQVPIVEATRTDQLEPPQNFQSRDTRLAVEPSADLILHLI